MEGCEVKRIIEEATGGFTACLGETVLLLCANYFYYGRLVGVNEDHVELADASLVYETGEWSADKFADAQVLPMDPLRVQIASIEAWGQHEVS